MSMFRRRLLIANALKKSSGINYPGLIAAWSAKGKTNEDEDKATLKDLTGNGHDITLNGFAFSEMSGYGGFLFKWNHPSPSFNNSIGPSSIYRATGVVKSSKVHITAINNLATFIENAGKVWGVGDTIPEYKVKISGLDTLTKDGNYLYYKKSDDTKIIFENDGIYTIKDLPITKLWFNSWGCYKLTNSCDFTIELLPEYPDALVFDGVDDFGINEDMPILTDYTIIAKRKDFNKKWATFISKSILGTSNWIDGAFVFERRIEIDENLGDKNNIISFGGYNNLSNIYSGLISYQTKNNYNNQNIKIGSKKDGTLLSIGCTSLKQEFWKGAFCSACLFDRSLDEQEIKEFIRKYIDKDYLLPNEQP